ncbi:hypothetical protein T265_06396 [Opisthorchis viverrini]|uniref:Uncharacterized protein n=1 Tax=Opisthorchis viverrini TaxID=6198 RepID=A0A074ZGD3_OPIVI|nr:hypothetical protein T265_06396 [Opisthorchis viverrini]KER26351.1 hypothetical protein T265_06396 [Opisthorchis viverrini]
MTSSDATAERFLSFSGLEPESAFRLFLSRLGQLGSTSVIVPPSVSMATRYQKRVRAELLLGQPGSTPALAQPSSGMAVRHRKGARAERFLLIGFCAPINIGGCSRTRWPGARWLIGKSANLLIGSSVVRTRPLHLDCPSLGLGNPARDTFTSEAYKIQLKNIHKYTGFKVRGSNPTSVSRLPCLGLGNLAVSQPSCNLRMAWQLGTERMLQLNDLY